MARLPPPAWRAGLDSFPALGRAGEASPDQIRLMLRTLLEERFQLRSYSEARNMPVYELVVDRNSSKVPAVKDRETGPKGSPPCRPSAKTGTGGLSFGLPSGVPALARWPIRAICGQVYTRQKGRRPRQSHEPSHPPDSTPCNPAWHRIPPPKNGVISFPFAIV